MTAHLILRFDAPLMSFGGVMVDNLGVCDEWPSASLLAGLFGNALGFRRVDVEQLQALQERLVFACRLDAAGQRVVDFQTVAMNKNDKAWTTSGEPQGRSGGAGTYESPHLRYRQYWADRIITVAFRLRQQTDGISLTQLQDALLKPKRPLFIGRKTCLPAVPLYLGLRDGANTLDVLQRVPALGRQQRYAVVSTERSFLFRATPKITNVSGLRNWRSGLHGGAQRMYEGEIGVAGKADNL